MGLLELMIAMTVLTVGMMGSMIMILTGMQSNSRNKTDNQATILDQEILEEFATLNAYPKPGFVLITDCTGNTHQASLGQGTYSATFPSGGNGATLSSVGDIDWTQPTPTLATTTTQGYAMRYQTCSGDIYEVRWNIMDASNAPTGTQSRLSLLTVSSREIAAQGSPLGMLYAPPTTLRTLIESGGF